MGADVVNYAHHVNTHGETISGAAREVYALIPSLTPGETEGLLARLQARLGMAKRSSSSTSPRGASGVDWLLAGIEHELRARGIIMGRDRLPVDALCPKYHARSRPAVAALVDALGGSPRAADLAALGMLAAECLADMLEQEGRLVSPRTMLQRAGDAAAAVEAAFPGYIARRMLSLCLGRS